MVKKAKEKNYEVDNDKKIVSAVVVKLTEREKKEVKNYLDLGYNLQPKEPKVRTKEEIEAAKKAAKEEQAANPYSKPNVEAFLQQEGNEALWEEYQQRYHEQAGTNRHRKNKNGEVKALEDKPVFLKSGEPKEKGFANCIGWFKEYFEYDAKAKEYKPVKKK